MAPVAVTEPFVTPPRTKSHHDKTPTRCAGSPHPHGLPSAEHEDRTKIFDYPDSAAQTITVSCKESSSNTCHFAFTGRISPAETAVKAGESIVLIGDASNTLYCAEPTKPTIGNCRATSIAPKRQVITKETSTDESQ